MGIDYLKKLNKRSEKGTMGKHLLITALAPALLLASCGQLAAAPTTAHSQAQELKVQADDVTLYARIAGNPEAEDVLLAVTMGPGLSSHYMASLEQLAGESFAVVTYDQRGTGRSTEPSGGYALLNYVADLEAVRQAAGAERVHLFGHCWGGLVAVRYATIHPDRVRSLVLWGGAWPSSEIVATGQQNLARRQAALQQGGIIPARPTAFEQILPVFLSDPHFELPDEFGQSQYDPRVEGETKSALGEYDITAQVAGLNHAVLFLWGEDDPFGLETAEATRDAFAAAPVEFVVIGECGHLWQECPDDFFSQMRVFLHRPPAD
jgi:pimeloyl-ACP methyl ester carboxylesterase